MGKQCPLYSLVVRDCLDFAEEKINVKRHRENNSGRGFSFFFVFS